MDEHLIRFNNDARLTFFDFETYSLNLNFLRNKPWQLGMVTVQNDKVLSEHDIIIKWPNPPKFNAETVKRIFHCTVPELYGRIEQDGVEPEVAFEIFHNEIEKADRIVGHNILGFDIYLLKEWYELMGKKWNHLWTRFIDTNCLSKAMKLSIKVKPDEDFMAWQYRLFHFIQKGLKTRLELMGKEMGIDHDYENLHDALVDISLNIKVFNKLKYQLEI